ncbi:MAG: transposase [Gemmatimonadota bacterium]|nr:MAG: transposase [Gemmatimonadota bacterium]
MKPVRLPPRSPNLNAHAETFVRTIKESCLDRPIFFGEGSLRRAINEFVSYYHHERNHQGLGNRLIDP